MSVISYPYPELSCVLGEAELVPEAVRSHALFTRLLQFIWHSAHVRHRLLVHERAETQAEILGDLGHVIG